MTPMGNQRYLRGCGVFAVLDAISAKFAIQKLLADQRYRAYRPSVKQCSPRVHALPIPLSKQELLDRIVFTDGLLYRLIYGYVIEHGVHKEVVYPYEGLFNGDCRCSDYAVSLYFHKFGMTYYSILVKYCVFLGK
uniref:Putative ovule protein n=1 Tax=Solanum chacoense TaxID=4108 RepID=A0A0V0I786_SOLCH